jgi:SAM-dependent methyltransferase
VSEVRPAGGGRPAPPANSQEAFHARDFDYVNGSPHLKHADLRQRVERSLRDLVDERKAATGQCRVLEVGAGHGDFTGVLRAAGAAVTVTEMSRPSADRISARFTGDHLVDVVYDPTATWADQTDDRFDVVACISVLHHIPDYAAFLTTAARLTRSDGCFVSWQDPTWFPRRGGLTHRVDQASYFAWRIGQGNLGQGLQTRIRRLRGVLDEANPNDMTEYHQVRSGVDELELERLARASYADVELTYYWSTQSALGQRLGARRNLPNTFALVARGRYAR